MRSLASVLVASLVVAVLGAPAARAQCYEWSDRFQSNGVTGGYVAAQCEHDDGSGGGPKLYVGGSFTKLAGVDASSIAEWDGVQWRSLSSNTSGVIEALVSFDDGNGAALYAAGSFTSIGGVAADNIAKWDGTHWSPLAGGLDNLATSLAVYDDGSGPALFVGGWFSQAGGVPAQLLAKWDGAAWSDPGSNFAGPPFPTVDALAVHDDGSGPALFVGGYFDTADGVTSKNVAKWDGVSWHAMGAGVSSYVYALATYDEGSGPRLFIGGAFNFVIGVGSSFAIARWDGVSISSMTGGGGSLLYNILALAVHDDGTGPALYAAGIPPSGGGSGYLPDLRRWNGTVWSTVGAAGGIANGSGDDSPTVHSLATYDDGNGARLFVGGAFAFAGGALANGIARWDAGTFATFGVNTTVDRKVRAFVEFDDGTGAQLYAAGDFDAAGSVNCGKIARFDGTTWSSLGSGAGADSWIDSLAVFDDGTGDALYAGGAFTTIDGAAARRVARWNGASWSALGSGIGNSFDNEVFALAVYDDGTGTALYAAGKFQVASGGTARRIAKWTGASWVPLGNGLDGTAYALEVFDDGNGAKLYVAGGFQHAGGLYTPTVARWTGSTWEAVVPLGQGALHALEVFDDGTGPALYTGYSKFDGTNWTAIGDFQNSIFTQPLALLAFDDGSGPALYAAGSFTMTNGVSANHIARWNGAQWSALAGGLAGSDIAALGEFDDGNGAGPALFVGGAITAAGGRPSTNVAKWSRACGCAPVSYCTAGTTTHGCSAHLSGVGVPSASTGSGFDLVVSNVEGQRTGLIFCSINGAKSDPWGAGSSFVCVKAPQQRTGNQFSNGTNGGCDGVLSLDFNAYLASHPNVLGQPFGAITTVWAQAWFRDPPAPKGTNLSDAVRFDVCP